MKIEGISRIGRGRREFFVRMTSEEMGVLSGLDWGTVDNMDTAQSVELCARVKRLLSVEDALTKLKPQIDNMRALASMIETQIPPIVAAANAGIEELKGGAE